MGDEMGLNNSQRALISMNLLQTGSEAINFLILKNNSGKLLEAEFLLEDIKELVSTVEKEIESFICEIPLSRLPEVVKNIIFLIEDIQGSKSLNDDESKNFKLKLLLPALYSLLRNEIAFLMEGFLNKEDFPDFYPESLSINKEDIIKEIKESEPIVSLVLLAYNKLDYTKQCLESILKYTTDYTYELILVNNGSTDGTEAYFDSIPQAKKIHLKYNIGATLGFNIGMMVAEGKYVAALCNDFIFTHNWLGNLVKCIESDENYGYVAPAATYISNHQQVSVKFNGIGEFHDFARKYNISDPLKWEERIVLLPNVLFIPTALIKRINYYDTRYYYGEFADDDISFKVRRAGFKCIFCKDTVLHHFGHITVGDDQRENKSLEVSRVIFQNKYGLDAWRDARFDLNLLNMTNLKGEVKKVLGIDVKCGGTPLHLSNILRSQGQDSVSISLFTTEDKYRNDLETVSNHVIFDDDINNLLNFYQAEQFDIIIIEKPIDEYEEISIKKLLLRLKEMLAPGGQIVFKINNPSYFENVYMLLQGTATCTKVYTTSVIKQSVSELCFSHIDVASIIVSDNTYIAKMFLLLTQKVNHQTETKQLLLTKEFIYRIS
ncbi:glycosyltransferase [Paenibacillus sp. FSL R7-0297]|uniref:glycosyltransferase family 2 protein n=1 Tax=Paenibacillus sp. FSL R7-0297 TaxID=2921680 RepID=UPI0030F950F6